MAYLRHLPADELKIDRAFITDLASDQRDQRLVCSTIDLAHALDLKIVAEGVEDEASLNLLVKAGCDTAQGYHVARPMSVDKLAAMLAPKKSDPLSINDLLESDVFTEKLPESGFSF